MSPKRARSTQQCEACQTRRAQKGLTICRACETETITRLNSQADLYQTLIVTLARQDRLDPAPEAGRSANQPLPYSPPAAKSLRDQRKLLWRWVWRLYEPQEPISGPTCRNCSHPSCRAAIESRIPTATIASYALWLIDHRAVWRLRPDAGEMVAGLQAMTIAALQAVDHPLMRAVLVGPCPQDGCAGQVSVFIPMDGSDRGSWMRCDRCKTEYPSREWHKLAATINARRTVAAAV